MFAALAAAVWLPTNETRKAVPSEVYRSEIAFLQLSGAKGSASRLYFVTGGA